jgi:hypothetical protein
MQNLSPRVPLAFQHLLMRGEETDPTPKNMAMDAPNSTARMAIKSREQRRVRGGSLSQIDTEWEMRGHIDAINMPIFPSNSNTHDSVARLTSNSRENATFYDSWPSHRKKKTRGLENSFPIIADDSWETGFGGSANDMEFLSDYGHSSQDVILQCRPRRTSEKEKLTNLREGKLVRWINYLSNVVVLRKVPVKQ